MLKTLKVITKTRYRKTNFKAFLFFLLFAVVIWIIAQFSKTYSELVDIPVEYVNVPNDKLLTDDKPEELKLSLEETGFGIAYTNFFPPTLTIDVSDSREEDGNFIYSMADHREAIETQMGINYDRSKFVEEEVVIGFEQRAEKKLPVQARIDLEYAVGFAAAGELELDTDSIMVSGPDIVLDTLEVLQTELLRASDVKTRLRGKLRIDTEMLSGVTVYQEEVNYSLEVDRFTEGRLEVPIELINVPSGQNVVIFPKHLIVFYRVSLEEFNSIEASDFKVVCDFSQLRDGQDFLIPRVQEKPDAVENVRMNENRISFIIKK